jgi:hypothetical protein
MERHGTAANFGIETNIQIVDPAMVTTKTGYQNGVSTGYNGYVNPNVPVVYDFTIENKSNVTINSLTFFDAKLDVNLTKDTITLNTETKIDKLSVTLYNADGSVKETVAAGKLDEAKLKDYLAAGLAAGQKIVIYGFQHTILDGEWEQRQNTDGTTSNHYFFNQLHTTALDSLNRQLTGDAHWVVQKHELDVQDYHVYEWVGKSVSLTQNELESHLVDAINKKNENNDFVADTSATEIEITSASGKTEGANAKAKLTSENAITYTGSKVGVDTFYYKITIKKSGANDYYTAVIAVAVYSYDVADNIYVLDYNLPVRLSGTDSDSPLVNNDTHDLGIVNPLDPAWSITGISGATTNYGAFDLKDGVLTYRMQKFLNGEDHVTVTTQVLEEGQTTVTKYTGVTMTQTVSVVPASVMYYEDNFITYDEENGKAIEGAQKIFPLPRKGKRGNKAGTHRISLNHLMIHIRRNDQKFPLLHIDKAILPYRHADPPGKSILNLIKGMLGILRKKALPLTAHNASPENAAFQYLIFNCNVLFHRFIIEDFPQKSIDLS